YFVIRGNDDMTIGMKLAATALLGTVLTTAAYATAQDKDNEGFGDTTYNTTTLQTPPLVPDGNSQMDCYIINVSKRPRYVTIDALDRPGTVVATWNGVLNPGTEAVAIAKAIEGPRSCRFEVEGQAKDFRASGLVVVPGVGSISALAAQ